MARTPNFRKNPIPAPPPAAASPGPPPPQDHTKIIEKMTGGMPLSQGALYSASGQSEYTKRQLEAVGWQEGDPIPEELPQVIKEIQEEIADDFAKAKKDMANLAVTKGPQKVVDIKDMPEEYQREIAELLAEHKKHVAEQQAGGGPEISPAASDSVKQAIAGAHEATKVMEEMRTARQAAAAEAPPVASVAPSAGAADGSHTCPKCGWDQRLTVEVTPTEQDKDHFIAGMLAPNGRLQKTYDILGGRLHITYRGLTAAETRMLFEQLGYDVRNGAIEGDGEYLLKLQGYRLALGLARIESETEVLVKIPPVNEIPYTPPGPDEPKRTPLADLYDWLISDGITNESLLRLSAKYHRDFQRIVEALEAKAGSSDF